MTTIELLVTKARRGLRLAGRWSFGVAPTFRFFLCGMSAVFLFSCALRPLHLSQLVDPDAQIRMIASGFAFAEGPAANNNGLLLWSDIPNSRIVALTPDGATRDFLTPSRKSNGLAFDRDGFLYACQREARRVVRIDVANKNAIQVLADSFDGKRLNSPNDLALDAHGGIYFTDPRSRGIDHFEQPVTGVYYVDAERRVTRVVDSLERPNGILVSPSGRWLVVAEMNKREIHRFEIIAPGQVTNGTVVFTGGPEIDGSGPDGMAHDRLGNIYATYKSLVVLGPDGALIGRVHTPEKPTNCTFGGTDNKTLFITTAKSVYALDMKVAGLEPFARK